MKSRRNHLPRKSSPDGVKARQEHRLRGFEKLPDDVARGMHRRDLRTPGSSAGHERKIGRLGLEN